MKVLWSSKISAKNTSDMVQAVVQTADKFLGLRNLSPGTLQSTLFSDIGLGGEMDSD